MTSTYINPKGQLYKDVNYPYPMSVPIDGIREFILTKSALDYHKSNGVDIGLLIIDEDCKLTNRKLDFFTVWPHKK